MPAADTLARVVMPRSASPQLLDAVETILRSGVETGLTSLLSTRGVNGAMRRVALSHPAHPGRVVDAIIRPAHAQAAQEVFGWRLARQLGIDYLFPAAAMRSDGSAMVQLVPGVTADAAGVGSVARLREEIAAMYRRTRPDLGDAGAVEQARVDVELAQAVDYIVANSDRRPANLMFDAASGAVSYIDIGNMGATGFQRFRPMLMHEFMGAGARGAIDLHPRTVAALRANLDEPTLRRLHGELARDLATYRPGPEATIRQRGLQRVLARTVARGSFADDMVARRQRLLDTGRLEYEPMRPPVAIPATFARAYGARVGVGLAAVNATAGAWLLRRPD